VGVFAGDTGRAISVDYRCKARPREPIGRLGAFLGPVVKREPIRVDDANTGVTGEA
jgi:hypothetical protein